MEGLSYKSQVSTVQYRRLLINELKTIKKINKFGMKILRTETASLTLWSQIFSFFTMKFETLPTVVIALFNFVLGSIWVLIVSSYSNLVEWF